MTHHAFEAIGTAWSLDFSPPSTRIFDQEKFFTELTELVEDFDAAYSRFRPDSLVAQYARAAGTYSLRSDFLPLLQLYKQFYDITDGLFTPLVGQLLVEAGYDAHYSLRSGSLSSVPSWVEVMDFDTTQLHMHQKALLDFGAAGKGYLVDLIALWLRTQGVRDYVLDGSGDIRRHQPTASAAPYAVGLEHPLDTKQAIGIAYLDKQSSIAGSATNRRTWGEWHHIVNPKQLQPVRTIVATWAIVRADTHPYPTMLADALATALFLVEPGLLREHFDFQFVIYYADGRVMQASDFVGEMFYHAS